MRAARLYVFRSVSLHYFAASSLSQSLAEPQHHPGAAELKAFNPQTPLVTCILFFYIHIIPNIPRFYFILPSSKSSFLDKRCVAGARMPGSRDVCLQKCIHIIPNTTTILFTELRTRNKQRNPNGPRIKFHVRKSHWVDENKTPPTPSNIMNTPPPSTSWILLPLLRSLSFVSPLPTPLLNLLISTAV